MLAGGGVGSSLETEDDGEDFSRTCGLSFFENTAKRFPKDRRSGLRTLGLNIMFWGPPAWAGAALGGCDFARDSNLSMSSFVDLPL